MAPVGRGVLGCSVRVVAVPGELGGVLVREIQREGGESGLCRRQWRGELSRTMIDRFQLGPKPLIL